MEFLNEIRDLLIRNGDPRTKSWFLLGDPVPLLGIWIFYLLSVVYGPKLMQDRKPIEPRKMMFFYNVFLVFLSAYMSYEYIMSSVLAGYNLTCQPVDRTTAPLPMRMAKVCWLFFISKVIELADTWFFIIRKKNSQITFLHVYHHSTMLWVWWSGATYVPGGQSFLNAMLNCFIHTVMYTYYSLSLLGPRIQKYLWWKRYLTQFQLVQFCLIIAHSSYNLFFTNCDFPQGFNIAAMLYSISLIILFVNFYIKSYRQHVPHKHHQNGKVE